MIHTGSGWFAGRTSTSLGKKCQRNIWELCPVNLFSGRWRALLCGSGILSAPTLLECDTSSEGRSTDNARLLGNARKAAAAQAASPPAATLMCTQGKMNSKFLTHQCTFRLWLELRLWSKSTANNNSIFFSPKITAYWSNRTFQNCGKEMSWLSLKEKEWKMNSCHVGAWWVEQPCPGCNEEGNYQQGRPSQNWNPLLPIVLMTKLGII